MIFVLEYEKVGIEFIIKRTKQSSFILEIYIYICLWARCKGICIGIFAQHVRY